MFCDWQEYAKSDSKSAHICDSNDQKAQLFCCAHLNEDRAFPCPYNPSETYKEGERLRIAHKDKEGKPEGRCEDFTPARPSSHC